MKARGMRITKQGTVVSNKMEKTVTVRVDQKVRHQRYQKIVLRSRKFYAHYEGDMIPVGTVVTISETRPISKLKRWRVVEQIETNETPNS
jgi:small subunit ribosomal protein S17